MSTFARLPAALSALLVGGILATAQSVNFEVRSFPDSPVALLNENPRVLRTGSERRQFVTVRNNSRKIIAGLVFEQAIGSGPEREIVTLERVTVIMRPGEKKRLSVAVGDLWNRIRPAGKAAAPAGKPALAVIGVEFLDGGYWRPPER
jgi:hypothetical protein